MNKKTGTILLGGMALMLGGYLSLFGFNLPVGPPEKPAAQIESFFWPHQKQLSAFELVDHNGEPYTDQHLKGRWQFLFFGYTHCPDICPITLNTMRQSKEKILVMRPDVENRMDFVFISVDGERDTPQHLKTYLQFFGGHFKGATGNDSQIDSLTGQLGVPYAIDDHEPGGQDYLVSHTGAIFLISPQGTLASIYQPPLSADQISGRFLDILAFMDTHA